MHDTTTIDQLDILLRIVASVGFGTLIGLERQYRARMAGLRTNALVSVGSALFVVLSAYGFESGDPTRVAAQIVSGIGFLGGGVILRDGLTVRGLNTAATLWCSAAVGALSGAGMYIPAAIGTVVVVGVNTALRSVGHAVDRAPDNGEVEVRATLAADGRDDRALETAISQLSMEPSVTAVRWDALPERVEQDL